MQDSDFELTIYSRKYWGEIIFYLIVVLIVGRINPFIFDINKFDSNIKNQWFIFLIFFLLSYILFKELTWLTGRVNLTVNSRNFIVTKYFFGIKFRKSYDISKISNLIIKHKVPGDSYMGTISTPSSLRIYLIKEPTILYFDYDGETESIGAHLKDFPAESIIKEIEIRK
jgi:hypothetical protein